MSINLLLLALAAASTALWLVQAQSGEEDPMTLAPDPIEPGRFNATIPPSGNGFCSLHPHQLTLHYQGCTADFVTFSCFGRCFTTEEPNHFYSRPDSTVEAYISMCNCCSATDWDIQPRYLELECPDNTTLEVIYFTVVLTECSCTACF